MSTASEREALSPLPSMGPGVQNSMVRLSSYGTAHFGPLIGESEVMRATFGRLERAAETDATLLLQGEPGTGKEEAAVAVHRQSARSAGPLLIVDCAASRGDALSVSLFGTQDEPGAFERASGGTLLLKNVGSLPLELQERVLGVLDHRAVQRMDSHASREIDVRLIASATGDLRRAVAEGGFRSDLYFRLAVLKVSMPALRERSEDIAPIVHAYLEARGASSEQRARLSGEEFVGRLRSAPWSQNVAELREYLERCLCTHAEQPLPLGEPLHAVESKASSRIDPSMSYADARKRAIGDFEEQYLRALLERTGGNVSKAAREAGIDRVYMHRLMRRHRVKR